MTLKWHGDRVRAAIASKVATGMEAALADAEQYTKQSLSRPGPSPEGQPPGRDTGELRDSIFHTVEQDGEDVSGYLGSSDPKARRLELGFVGTDSRGRRYSQGPRPFLRPAVFNRKREFMSRFVEGGGKKAGST